MRSPERGTCLALFTDVKKHPWLALAAALLLANQSVEVLRAGATPDQELVRDIERAITRYAFFTVFDDVSIDIDDEGVVVISGAVTALNKRTAIAQRIAAVDGVVGVRNDLDVLPASHRDTKLRYRIARALYGSSTFWHYAARQNPPIHVLVRHGQVTLTGIVDSDTERAIAGVLASQFSAISLTNKLRLAGELRRNQTVLD